LTRSAMSPVLENPGLGDDAFLMPFQPSLVWDRCLKAGGELPAAGLPNRFLAMIPADPEGKMALTLGGFRVDLDMAFVVWAKCGFCFVRMGSRRQGARAWKPMRLDRSVSWRAPTKQS